MATTKKNTACVSIFYGNDSYWVTASAREYLAQRVPEERQVFGLDTIDALVESPGAAALAIRKCLEAVDTPSFMGGDKVVWLKNASFLGAAGRATRGEEVKSCLERLTNLIKKGIMPGVSLMVTAPDVDKRSAFYKACEKAGEVKEFSVTEKAYQIDQQAVAIVQAALKDAGLTGGAGAVEAMVEREGCDTQQIRNEVEKLRNYLGERKEVTRDDIEAVVCSVRGSQAWDLADAVVERKLVKALQVLNRLLYQKTSALYIMSILEGRFREFLVYREAMERGWVRTSSGSYGRMNASWDGIPEEAAALVGEILGKDPRTMPGFITGLRAQQAMVFSKPAILKIQKRLLEAHRLLLTTPTEPQWILEMLLIRILGRRPAAAPAKPA
jgi:DNA polymerase-3 subunit delta